MVPGVPMDVFSAEYRPVLVPSGDLTFRGLSFVLRTSLRLPVLTFYGENSLLAISRLLFFLMPTTLAVPGFFSFVVDLILS
jgi:hypothetical protein